MGLRHLWLGLSLAIALSVAFKPAAADKARPAMPHLAPGKVQEMIGPEATVVSTVHYQVWIGLDCSNGYNCYGSFPPAGPKHRLNITRITCSIGTSGSTTYYYGFIGDNTGTVYQYLPLDYAMPYEMLINRAVDMQVTGSQHLVVTLSLLTQVAGAANCSASGTRDALR